MQVIETTKYLLIYTEYHSVCPLVEIGGIGTPPCNPFPASECAPPQSKGVGGLTRLRMGGGGVPFPTHGEKA